MDLFWFRNSGPLGQADLFFLFRTSALYSGAYPRGALRALAPRVTKGAQKNKKGRERKIEEKGKERKKERKKERNQHDE